MEKYNWENVAMELILHGGNARAEAYDALAAVKEGDHKKAEEHLKNSSNELKLAHEAQTKVLQEMAQGKDESPNLLMVHAHGHLMTAMTEKSLIEELILLYKRINKAEN